MLRRALLRSAQRRKTGCRTEAEAKAITRQLVKLGSDSLWNKALELLGAGSSLVHTNAVISACSKAKQWQQALALLVDSPLRDAVSLAAALGAKPPWRQVLQLLQAAERWQLRSDEIVASAAISSCSHRYQWEVSLALLMKFKVEESTVAVGAVISGAEHSAQWQVAIALLNNLRTKVRPSFIAFSTTVLACSKSSQWEAVMQLLEEEGRALDAVTCTAAITACRDGHNWQFALSLLFDALDCQPSPFQQRGEAPSLTSSNACLSALERSSRWQLAICMLINDLPARRLQLDEVSFNTTISCCTARLKWQHALALLRRMQQHQLREDAVTWNACMTACSNGQKAELALDLFQEFKCHGNVSTAVANAAIAACVPTHAWQFAVELFQQLQRGCTSEEKSLDAAADRVSFNTTLAACAASQAWEMALSLAAEAALDEMALGAVISAMGTRWKEAIQLAQRAATFQQSPGRCTIQQQLRRALILAGKVRKNSMTCAKVSIDGGWWSFMMVSSWNHLAALP
eukprot:s858_g19.t1